MSPGLPWSLALLFVIKFMWKHKISQAQTAATCERSVNKITCIFLSCLRSEDYDVAQGDAHFTNSGLVVSARLLKFEMHSTCLRCRGVKELSMTFITLEREI